MCVNALFFQSFDAKILGRLNLKIFFGTPIKITCSERKFGGSVIYTSFFYDNFPGCMGSAMFDMVLHEHARVLFGSLLTSSREICLVFCNTFDNWSFLSPTPHTLKKLIMMNILDCEFKVTKKINIFHIKDIYFLNYS